MKSIFLQLAGNTIKAHRLEQSPTLISSHGKKYYLENFYFGDWVALRNQSNKIIGFKLIPLVDDDYLEKFILKADFIKLATNAIIENNKKYTYISILIEPTQLFSEDNMNYIEAAIFHDRQNDFIIRLDGFSDEDWSQLGFAD